MRTLTRFGAWPNCRLEVDENMNDKETKLRDFGARNLGGETCEETLLAAMRDLRDAGVSSGEVEAYLETLRAGANDEQDDLIVDLLCVTVGWCGPGALVW